MLFLNEDILEKAGVNADELTTWPQVQAAAKKIKEKTGKYGLYISESNDNWSNQQLVESTGTQTIADGKAAFATEGGIAAYKMWGDMVADGSALHISTDEGYQAFVSGDVGMLHATIAQRTNITQNGKFKSTAIKVPGWEGEALKVPAGGALLAVTAQEEKQQKAAWQFLKFLYEADSVATWTESTGYLPMTIHAVEENADLKKLVEEDKMFRASYSQMENLVPFASFPGTNGLQASQMLLDMRDQILGGKVSAEKAVTDAQKKINELLK
ncbi:extracellular solute-binding protein [Bacillus sp. N9]